MTRCIAHNGVEGIARLRSSSRFGTSGWDIHYVEPKSLFDFLVHGL